MTELGLLPEAEARRSSPKSDRVLKDTAFYVFLHYLRNGNANQLRVAPRPGMENLTVKLVDVDEDLLKHYYWRDINDFQKYEHERVRYEQCSIFDPKNPQVAQISRVVLTSNGEPDETTREVMCMYCQCAKFFGVHNCSLKYHVLRHHWGSGVPNTQITKMVFNDLINGRGVTSSLEG